MKWFTVLLTYMPVVLSGVVAVEGAIKAPGATKKQIVLGAILAGAQTGEQIPEAHVQAIGGLIDVVVRMLNETGVFTKTATA